VVGAVIAIIAFFMSWKAAAWFGGNQVQIWILRVMTPAVFGWMYGRLAFQYTSNPFPYAKGRVVTLGWDRSPRQSLKQRLLIFSCYFAAAFAGFWGIWGAKETVIQVGLLCLMVIFLSVARLLRKLANPRPPGGH
jgi:hypothetical protein